MMEIQTAEKLQRSQCKPCEGGVEACDLDAARAQLKALEKWGISEDGKRISRKWKMKNFVQAVELLKRVAEIAELDQHHPDLHLTNYRILQIELTTHAIGGLSENDFILAAKIDQTAEAYSQ